MTNRSSFRYFKTSPALWAEGDLPPPKQTFARLFQINIGHPKILDQEDQPMSFEVGEMTFIRPQSHAKFKLLEMLKLIYH